MFCLPFSNGHVKRIFSTLKVTKTDQKTNLQTSNLCDIFEIKVEGPSLSDFDAKHVSGKTAKQQEESIMLQERNTDLESHQALEKDNHPFSQALLALMTLY